MVIDMHPHAKLYAFLWSASLALAFSFGTTQLLVSFVPTPSNQVLGLTHVVLFMLLWRQSFDFFAAHCLQRIDLQNNGFLIETLTHDRLFIEFSQLRSFRVRTFNHRCFLTFSYEHNARVRQQFVYFSVLNLDQKVIDQFNLYLQHNIAQRSSDL